jgi:hypothetical protein
MNSSLLEDFGFRLPHTLDFPDETFHDCKKRFATEPVKVDLICMNASQLRIIQFALSAGPLLFLVAITSVGMAGQDRFVGDALIYVGIAAAAGSLFVALLLPQNMIRSSDGSFEKPTVESAMGRYKTAKIIQWAIVESAAMVNAVAYFLSGTFMPGLVAAGLALFILFLRPSQEELQTWINKL